MGPRASGLQPQGSAAGAVGPLSGRDRGSLSSSPSFLGSRQALVCCVHLFSGLPSVSHPCWPPTRAETVLVLFTWSSDAGPAPGARSRCCEIHGGPLTVAIDSRGRCPSPPTTWNSVPCSDPAGGTEGLTLMGGEGSLGSPRRSALWRRRRGGRCVQGCPRWPPPLLSPFSALQASPALDTGCPGGAQP